MIRGRYETESKNARLCDVDGGLFFFVPIAGRRSELLVFHEEAPGKVLCWQNPQMHQM